MAPYAYRTLSVIGRCPNLGEKAEEDALLAVVPPVFTPVEGGVSLPHGALTHVWSHKYVKPI